MRKQLITNAFFVIIISVSMVACDWQQEQKDPSVYFIPESIRGEVIIVHDFKQGQKSAMKGTKRSYEIPENGILYSRAPLTYGLASDDYYLVDKRGKKKGITIEVNTKNDQELCIYNITTGTITIDKIKYPYEAFMVCRKDSIEYYNDFTLNLSK